MKLKVRCPSCAKLYEVESEDIHSDTPVFQCISCDNRFGFEYPPFDALMVETFLVPTNAAKMLAAQQQEAAPEPTSDQSMKACPKCGALNGRRSKECYSCHVIFEKLEGLPQDTTLRAQPSLVRKWKELLENFENRDLHEAFIRSCHELDAPRFAILKYEEIKAAQGGDVLCDQMIAQINSMMMVGLSQRPTNAFNRASAGAAAENSAGRPKWRKYLYWGPFTTSALMILWGVLSLAHRNLIGVGVALFCMATGLMVMTKGKISLSDFLE